MINARLGNEYLRQNQLEHAKFKLEKSLDQDDSIPLAHSSYAVLMLRIGEKDKAEKHFRIALDLDAKDPDTSNNFGLFLCEEGEFEEAESFFKRAYSDPFYSKKEIALVNSGICQYRNGKQQEGIKQIKSALILNPDYGLAYRQLALFYLELNQIKAANEYLQNFFDRFGYSLSSLQIGLKLARQRSDVPQFENYLSIMGRKYSNTPEYRAILEDLKVNPVRRKK